VHLSRFAARVTISRVVDWAHVVLSAKVVVVDDADQIHVLKAGREISLEIIEQRIVVVTSYLLHSHSGIAPSGLPSANASSFMACTFTRSSSSCQGSRFLQYHVDNQDLALAVILPSQHILVVGGQWGKTNGSSIAVLEVTFP
jgi:hypothetical protein